ncbi:MAG: ABC transporter substrate-binding protein [Acidimicrobiia bacterium]
MKRVLSLFLPICLVSLTVACGSDDDATDRVDDSASAQTTAPAASESSGPAETTGPADTTGPAETTASSAPAETTGPSEDFDESADLRILSVIAPRTLDPHQETAVWDHTFFTMVYDRLLTVGNETDTYALEPMLATDWTFSDDGLTLDLNLREGVSFHDGTPFDADAAKANLDYAMSEAASPKVRDSLAAVDSVEVVDPTTIRLNLSRPTTTILMALAYGGGAMVSPAALADGRDLSASTSGAGTGAYEVTEWTPDVIARFERVSEDHWDPNAGHLNSITISYAAEGQTRAAALSSGQADLVQIVTADLGVLGTDLENAGFVAHPVDTVLTQSLRLRGVGPFADKRVRQAIAHPIDRAAFADGLFEGNCKAADSLSQDDSPLYTADNANLYPYDLDEARALLAEAGVDGLTFTGGAASGATGERVATVHQQVLAEVGVTAELRLHTTAETITLYNEGQVDGSWTSTNTGSADAVATYQAMVNWTFGDPAIDGAVGDLLAEAEATLDEDARLDLLRQVEHIILEEGWVIPICRSKQGWYGTDRVTNVDSMPLQRSGIPDFYRLAVLADS